MVSEETVPQNQGMNQIQIQLGVLQGTVNTLLSELGRRVTENHDVSVKLRNDLTAVKDEGVRSVNEVRNTVTQNTSAITELRNDLGEVKEKQNSSLQRAVLVLSPVLTVIGLLWGFFGGKT